MLRYWLGGWQFLWLALLWMSLTVLKSVCQVCEECLSGGICLIFSLLITLGLCVLEENRGKVPCSSCRIKDSCYHLYEAAFGRFLPWEVFHFPCPSYPLWKEVTMLPLLSWEWWTPFFRTEYLHKWFIIFLQGTFISSLHLFDSLCMHHMYL